MDKDAYIKQLETENAELKKRIEELERLLGMNSKNSSKPPSSEMRGVSATDRCSQHKQYLWTFVKDRDVEPTNNFAERIVRQGVLWRKSSFGTQSHRGARYVERILTVCATCQLQERSVIRYLRDACRCHLNGIPAPSLIKNL